MKNDLLPSTDIPHLPPKKWYEQEVRRSIFVPSPLSTVRDQISGTLSQGSFKEKGFLAATIKCTGTITGNFMDLTMEIPAGKQGQLSYHMFGELADHSNGCLIQVTVRDSNTFYTYLVVAVFIAIIYIRNRADNGIFLTFFFGGFTFLALILQHSMGVNAVTKAIRYIAMKPA